MAFANLQIFLTSVTAANQRDYPWAQNTVGTLINFGGGSSGLLAWADDDNRKSWARIDGSNFAYYELEVLNSTHIRVYRVTELGEATTEDVTVAAGATVTTLVHGVSITLAGTLTPGDKASVWPAIFALSGNNFYVIRGVAGSNVKLAIYNPGDVSHYLAELRLGRATWFTNSAAAGPLAGVRAVLDTVVADVYAVTIEAGTNSGLKFTFTGTYNTYTADDVATGSTDNPLDDSATTGITFDVTALGSTIQTATIYVSDLADGLELAPDNAGTPGTWVSWNNSTGLQIPLNRAGYSDQLIPAAQTIYAWVRWNGDVSHPMGRGLARLYMRSHESALITT